MKAKTQNKGSALVARPSVQAKKLNPMQRLKEAMKKGIPFEDMIEVSLVGGVGVIGTGLITNQDGRSFIITDIINSSYNTSTPLVPTSDFFFQISDTGSNYQMSYVPIHASCLGSGKLPTKLEIPYILRPTADMQFSLANNSATPIVVQITVRGYKVERSSLDQEIRNIGTVFWDMFRIDPDKGFPLAGAQTLKAIINNKDERTFLINEYTAYSKHQSGSQTNFFKAYFRDSASRQTLAQKYISGGAMGTGEFPTKFNVSYPLKSQNQFECEAANNYVSESQTLYIVMKGVKIS